VRGARCAGRSKTGELINRLASDVTVVQKAVTNNVTNALRAAGPLSLSGGHLGRGVSN